MDSRRMEALVPQINLGATVCARLKRLYFDQQPWIECYRLVGDRLTELKKVARKFYADKSELDMLKELVKFNDSDIIDALGYPNQGKNKVECIANMEV